MNMDFQPDYRQIEKMLHNQRPDRLPLYEHQIDKPFIEKVIGREIELQGNKRGDFEDYYPQTIGFWNDIIRQHILPQYKRVIDLVHGANKKFLLHSCGNIFEIMDDVIALGIDDKHSNEDEIAPFDQWIEKYNKKLVFLGVMM